MCGLVGLISKTPVAPQLSVALQALQHRGQDSCGIYTKNDTRFPGHKGVGLARDVFTEAALKLLPGTVGLGHVRYPTIGRGVRADAQPFFERRPGVIMAHNGNITNYARLRSQLGERSVHLLSNCDIEPVLCIFGEELMRRRRRAHTIDDVVAALRDTVKVVEGAYTIACVLDIDSEPTLVAMRDPHGIRPGVWGKRDGDWIVASESVALDALGFQHAGDLVPGEAVFLRCGQEPVHRLVERQLPAPCVFEAIYFSRPDSVEQCQTVYQRRLDLGRQLAAEWSEKGFTADRVIAVPDTARPAAIAFAEELNVPCREGFIKNRYSGRTFIMGDKGRREAALRLKLNLIREEFVGKRVVVMDDSVVRGSTIQRLLSLIKAQSPAEVHFAVHSPPVLNPCYYGIDMSTEEELAARRYVPEDARPDTGLNRDEQRRLEAAWAKELGIDSITFLSVEGMSKVFPKRRCAACFDGRYPLAVGQEHRHSIIADRTCGRRMAPAP